MFTSRKPAQPSSASKNPFFAKPATDRAPANAAATPKPQVGASAATLYIVYGENFKRGEPQIWFIKPVTARVPFLKQVGMQHGAYVAMMNADIRRAIAFVDREHRVKNCTVSCTLADGRQVVLQPHDDGRCDHRSTALSGIAA